MARPSLTIGVSGINAVDNPGPGVGVARSLREAADLDVRIVGLAYDAMEPGIYMDQVVDEAYLLPYPSAGHDAYRARLLYDARALDGEPVLPDGDIELPQDSTDEVIRHLLGTATQDRRSHEDGGAG